METKRKEESQGEAWGYFLNELETVNPATSKIYLRCFKKFLDETGLTPESFYQFVKTNIENPDPRRIKLVENRLKTYYTDLLLGKGLHLNTIKNYEKSIIFFLSANELKKDVTYRFKINGNVKDTHMDQFQSDGKDKVEVEEIREMLAVQGHPRNRSVILTLRDSGLRVSDICRIQIKHIQPIIDDPALQFYTFEIMPLKNLGQTDPLFANVVLGYESIESIRKWLEYRQTKYGLDSDPESYLFCVTYNTHHSKIGDRLSPNALTRMVKSTREKARLTKEISPHSFRKLHTTALTSGGVPELWVNKIQGKRGKGTQGTYQKPNEGEIIGVYNKAYSKLALFTPESETVKTLEETVKQQQKQIDALLKMRIGKTENDIVEIGLDDQAQLDAIYSALPETEKAKEIQAIKDQVGEMMKRLEALSK